MPSLDLTARLATADWRRRTRRLYDEVRDTAARSGPAVAHAVWRQGRDELFASHPASPLSADLRSVFTGLPVTAYDEAWRFEVDVRPVARHDDGHDGGDRYEAVTGTDGVVPFERLGEVVLPTPGGEMTLMVWWLASYGGGLFLPLRDGSCGTTEPAADGTEPAFGGGRYVLDGVKGADLGGSLEDGRLVVDLNFAYNPSCAYDPDWACPLAPAPNTTAVPVPVGERHCGPWVTV